MNTNTSQVSKKKPSKLVIGLMVAGITGLVGTAGIVSASPGDKPSKSQCSNAGYSNYGQCVREWAQARGNGNGYGGNITISPTVNVNGNNNIVNVIIRVIFG